jgi:hypothetical protein
MAKPSATKARYSVTRDFDYLTVRQYDVTLDRSHAHFRRTDDSSGTQIPMWQFKRALNDGSLVLA